MRYNKSRVFLADDDPEDRLFFKIAIDQIDDLVVALETFNDGESLMQHLAECKDLPYIVFLDLNMPGKSGHTCLEEIRQNSRYDKVSVAIYSTSATDEDIEATFVSGANVYIPKPDDVATLRQIIRHVLKTDLGFSLSNISKENFLLRM
ncbi:response regulator [Flavobacterium sp.]|uniref:response regulator n=1 Tax=Flavobacterium sp. TaxID=239 RepID=UPI001221AD76|nr:response regulator [Flavobacterium sp.]RZJ72563.1 MAG: response regulator [Flavobacterium sp.]